MEKISEMIERMCPNGVERVRLGDYCEILRGKRLTKAQLTDYDKYPVIHGGTTPMGYYTEPNRKAGTTIVVNTGNAGSVFYIDKEFWSSDACFALYPCEKINDKYLYICVYGCEKQIKNRIRAGAMPTIDSLAVESLTIPLPPLPIQQEIVGILDTFTQLQSNLEAELAARQKQYEYYRNKLLTFDEKDESVEWKKLGEVCNISRGKRVVRKDLAEFGSFPVFQNSLKPLGYTEISNYPANTPFVISAGAAGEVGYSFTKYWGADDCFSVLINETVISRYVYHWLKIKEGFLQSRIRGGAIKRLSREYVDNLSIPIPTYNCQQEIVSILDAFETLISNIKQELEARKKQYEYYREQLLIFE